METKGFVKTAAVLLVLLGSVMALSGLASAAVDPNVVLSNYALSSPTAAPGTTVNLTMTFTNIVSTPCAQEVSVQLADSYPLSILGPDTQYFPNQLCLSDNASADTVTFQVPIDPLATTGTYPIDVVTDFQQDFLKYTNTNIVNIKVQGEPILGASVVSSNPVDIYPGDTASITVDFSNTGTGPIESALATLSTSTGVEVKWAGATQQLGTIGAHSSATAVYTVEVPKSLPSGSYPLNLGVSYVDEQNATTQQSIPIVVQVKPQADFTAASSDSLEIGQTDSATITLTNTGSQAAKELKVTIEPVYPFGTDGTVRYVQDLEPGQSVDLQYQVTVDKEATIGNQILTFALNYQDPDGNKFSDTTDFSLNVRAQTPLELAESYWWLLAIVVIAAAFLVRKRMADAKKKGAAAKG